MLAIRDNIHTDIYSQLPEIFREEGTPIAELLSAYYQWLDARNPRNLSAIGDIDSTFEEYLIFFKEKYLKDFPTKRADNNIDVRFLVKHIIDLYRRKGSEESLRLLFRMVFNEEVEIFYPATSILRPSDSVWSGVTYLEMKPVMSHENYPIRKLDAITGDVSGARAFVDEVLFVRINGPLIPIIYVSNTDGTFSPDDTFTVRRGEEFYVTGRLFRGSIGSLDVLRRNRVPGQNVGDIVRLISNRQGIGATAIVSEVAADITGQIEFELEDSGWGLVYGEWYNDNAPELDPTSTAYNGGVLYNSSIYTPPATFLNDIVISDQVVVLAQDETIDVRLGDTLQVTDAIIQPISTAINNIPIATPTLEFVAGDVDTNLDLINIDSHGLTTGVPVYYTIGQGNTGITGLDEETIYYLIRENDNQIKLADSLFNATQGTNIVLPDTGVTELDLVTGNPIQRSLLKCLINYFPETAGQTLSINTAFYNVGNTEVTYETSQNHGYQVGDSVNITGVTPEIYNQNNALIIAENGFSQFTIEKITAPADTYSDGGEVSKTTKFLTEISGSGTIIDTDDERKLVFFKSSDPLPELPDNGFIDIDFTNVAKDVNNNVIIPDISIVRISPQNDSAHFDISVTNSEEVSLITDIIGDFENTTLVKFVKDTDIGFNATTEQITSSTTDLSIFNPGDLLTITGSASNDGTEIYTVVTAATNAITVSENITVTEAAGNEITIETNTSTNYGMTGSGNENLETTLGDAFEIVNVRIGEIDGIFVRSTGFDYQNDVKGFVRQDRIANFDKRNLIIEFNIIDFLLTEGDEITQNRTVENLNYDPGDPQSTPTIPYVSKARYIRRVENNFYFKQVSFYDFDPELPVTIFSRDYNIISLQRDPESEPMGGNATIQGTAKFETGQIESVNIISSGFRYIPNETVTITSLNDNTPLAFATARVNSNGKGAGSWKTKTAFLSESTRAIHDNNYYQEYSYDISTRVPPGTYEELIKDTVGVAGTKQFSSPLINTINDTPTDLDVELQVFDISDAIFTEEGTPNNTFIVDPSTVLISTTSIADPGSNLVATVLTFNSEITIEE